MTLSKTNGNNSAAGLRWPRLWCFVPGAACEGETLEESHQGTDVAALNPLASSQQQKAADLGSIPHMLLPPLSPSDKKTPQAPSPPTHSHSSSSTLRSGTTLGPSSCDSDTLTTHSSQPLSSLLDNSTVLRLLSPSFKDLPVDIEADLSLDMSSGLVVGLTPSSSGLPSHGGSPSPTHPLRASPLPSTPLQPGRIKLPPIHRSYTSHAGITKTAGLLASPSWGGMKASPSTPTLKHLEHAPAQAPAPVRRAPRKVTTLPAKGTAAKPFLSAVHAGATGQPVYQACDALQVLVQSSCRGDKMRLSPTMQRWNTMVMHAVKEPRTSTPKLRHSPFTAGERGLHADLYTQGGQGVPAPKAPASGGL